MYRKISLLAIFVSAIMLIGAGCVSFKNTAAGPMGAFRSADKGESWTQINSYPTSQGVKSLAGLKVYRFFPDPSDPNTLYMATRGQGLFYTYNKGESWNVVEAMNNKFIYAVAVDPKDKCNIVVSDGPHVFRTTDCSRNWSLVYNDDRANEKAVALAFDYGNTKLVYAALSGGQVLVSNDGGGSWRVAKDFKTNLQYLATSPLAPGRIYVAGAGLARSDDGGNNWTSLTEGLKIFNDNLNFYRLVLHPTEKDILFWISKYGIVRSNDAGKTWSDLKLLNPAGSVNIYALAISPKDSNEMYYVGTVLGEKNSSRSTFYKSVDGGKTWVTKKLPTNTIPVSLLIHPKETNTLFMGFTTP